MHYIIYFIILIEQIVVLFFGLVLAPNINVNVINQDESVELDVELCGLGRKHNIKLTKEEYNEIEFNFRPAIKPYNSNL